MIKKTQYLLTTDADEDEAKTLFEEARDYYSSFSNPQSDLIADEFTDAIKFLKKGNLKKTAAIKLLDTYEEDLRDSTYPMRHQKVCEFLSKI